jgi:alkylation response protein AidB-like acyl-CoA dehydrogenase
MSTTSTQPDLLYSQEEEALRAAVRDLLTDRCDAAGVIARVETDAPHDLALWKMLADGMGLAGLLVPEDRGGQGATHREAAVVLEELGRAVAPVPYLTSAVVATEALLACADAGELVEELASGRGIGVLAVGLHTAPGAAFPAVRLEDGTLHGELTGIADAAVADVLLVPADDGGLYAVEAGAATVVPQTSLDLTRPLARVVLDGAPGRRLGEAGPAVRRALRAGAGLLASEQLGVADWCLTETVRHLKDRKQFNRPVGGFSSRTTAASRHSSTASPSCGWRWPASGRPRGPPPTPWRRASTPTSPSPSPRPTPRPSRSAPPRRRCNCTAASA